MNKLSIFISLFLLTVCVYLPYAAAAAKEPFYCYVCEDCHHLNMALQKCPDDAWGCVTMRPNRQTVVRDCYTKETDDLECHLGNIANKTCHFCNNYNGCNGERPDALVCRSCDWTTTGTCAVQRVCRAPFGTESPFCYILYRYPWGFHFGCLDEMSPTIEVLMAQDIVRLTYHWCDSNDCNWHAKNFWPAWDHLLDPYRICHVCFGKAYCGPKPCDPEYIYSRFCFKRFQDEDHLCMSDMSDFYVRAFIASGRDLKCTSDNCNKNVSYPLYFCDRFTNLRAEAVTDQNDACIVFKCE